MGPARPDGDTSGCGAPRGPLSRAGRAWPRLPRRHAPWRAARRRSPSPRPGSVGVRVAHGLLGVAGGLGERALGLGRGVGDGRRGLAGRGAGRRAVDGRSGGRRTPVGEPAAAGRRTVPTGTTASGPSRRRRPHRRRDTRRGGGGPRPPPGTLAPASGRWSTSGRRCWADRSPVSSSDSTGRPASSAELTGRTSGIWSDGRGPAPVEARHPTPRSASVRSPAWQAAPCRPGHPLRRDPAKPRLTSL